MTFHIENLNRLYTEKKFQELQKQSYSLIKKNFLKINDDNYKIYLFYGLSLFKNNHLKEAIEVFEKLSIFKENFEVNFHLGNCFLSNSNFKKSREYFEKCIKENPKFIDSYIQWLKTFRSDHFDIFNNKVNDLLEKHPSNLKLLFEIGNIYFEMNEFFYAENIYNKILSNKKNEKNVLVLLRLAACKDTSLHTEEAIKINKDILKLEPDLLDSKMNLANLYRSINQKDKALKILEEITNQYPYNLEARRQFSIIHKFKEDQDTHFVFFKNLEKKPFFKNLDEYSKTLYYFSLSKAYEDIGDYKLSAINLKKGNRIRRKNIFYNEKVIFEQFDEIKNFTSKEKIFNFRNHNSSDKPIFIVGMPRSGTTLVEQIISSHSQVFGAGELFYFQRLVKRYFPEAEPKKFIDSLNKSLNNYSKIMHDEYLNSIERLNLDKKNKFVTDKNPFNFIFISLIKIVFPKSKIIYCKRNQKDNCLSIFKNFFPMAGIGFAYDENELNRYYLKHCELMDYFISVFGSEIYTVEYEKLINNNKFEVEKLLNFVGLPWEDSCLEFYKNKNAVKTLSTTQVRSKITNQSIDSWKKYENFLPLLFKNF